MFLLHYLVQAGMFFTIPLFLSVRSGCRRWTPASASCRCRSPCWPRPSASPGFFPDASPRRVVRLGLLAMFAGIVVLMSAIDADAEPES